MDERIWLRHDETGAYFHCPAEAVEDWQALGWEPGEEPEPEVSPVVAENLAWRVEQSSAEAEPKPKPARRGEPKELTHG